MSGGAPAVALALVLAIAAPPPSFAQFAYEDGTVPYVSTPEDVVHRMLRIAEVGPADVVVDLGSGDGRILIEAARRHGARARGVEIDSRLARASLEWAARAGVAERVRIETGDLFHADLSDATVVTLYLLPEANLKLRPRLLALRPGTRVVSHDWNMGDWLPDETIEMRSPEKPVGARGALTRVHLWVIPADAGGRWRSELDTHGGSWEFRIAQRYQMIEVEGRAAGREMYVRGTRLRGDELKMVVTGTVAGRPWNHLFRGTVAGDRIDGELTVSDGEQQRRMGWTARRIP